MRYSWDSIFVKITFLFLIAIVCFVGFSIYFIADKLEEEQELSQARLYQVANTINEIYKSGRNINVIKNYLERNNFKRVEKEVQTREEDRLAAMLFGSVARINNTDEGVQIILQSPYETLLYQEKNKKMPYERLYIIVFIGIGILSLIYVILIKQLMPLKTLRSQINKMQAGEINEYLKLKSHANNEIELLENAFYKFSNKIRSVNEGRLLFLRSIMHELKTPITKGRIVAEMVDNEVQKKRLCNVFSRLNALIFEFSKIEQLSAQLYNIKKSEFLLQDLLSHAYEMMMLEDISRIEVLNPYSLIKADFELLAIAVKNMLDNAFKYNKGDKICIFIQKDELCVQNVGDPLTHRIDDYMKPYVRDDKQNIQGLGLGLYIIKTIVDSQGFELDYKYKELKNIFIIRGCVVDNFCTLEDRVKHIQNLENEAKI